MARRSNPLRPRSTQVPHAFLTDAVLKRYGLRRIYRSPEEPPAYAGRKTSCVRRLTVVVWNAPWMGLTRLWRNRGSVANNLFQSFS
jgi:hypothetical protein